MVWNAMLDCRGTGSSREGVIDSLAQAASTMLSSRLKPVPRRFAVCFIARLQGSCGSLERAASRQLIIQVLVLPAVITRQQQIQRDGRDGAEGDAFEAEIVRTVAGADQYAANAEHQRH